MQERKHKQKLQDKEEQDQEQEKEKKRKSRTMGGCSNKNKKGAEVGAGSDNKQNSHLGYDGSCCECLVCLNN